MAFRFINIVLATLFFISSTGFVINKHYCLGELQETAVIMKAKSCHEKIAKTDLPQECPVHKNATDCEEDKDCCNDKTEFLKLEIDQDITPSEFHPLNTSVDVSVPFSIFDVEWQSYDTYPVHFKHYKPPHIVCDRPVSLQTFLI